MIRQSICRRVYLFHNGYRFFIPTSQEISSKDLAAIQRPKGNSMMLSLLCFRCRECVLGVWRNIGLPPTFQHWNTLLEDIYKAVEPAELLKTALTFSPICLHYCPLEVDIECWNATPPDRGFIYPTAIHKLNSGTVEPTATNKLGILYIPNLFVPLYFYLLLLSFFFLCCWERINFTVCEPCNDNKSISFI